jgi:hypothetical protein
MMIEKRLRLSGVLILTGLGIQGITLLWNHPLAFMAFLLGVPFTAAGTLVYLYSLAAHSKHSE